VPTGFSGPRIRSTWSTGRGTRVIQRSRATSGTARTGDTVTGPTTLAGLLRRRRPTGHRARARDVRAGQRPDQDDRGGHRGHPLGAGPRDGDDPSAGPQHHRADHNHNRKDHRTDPAAVPRGVRRRRGAGAVGLALGQGSARGDAIPTSEQRVRAVVIGSGLGGAIAAYRLAKAGVRTVVWNAAGAGRSRRPATRFPAVPAARNRPFLVPDPVARFPDAAARAVPAVHGTVREGRRGRHERALRRRGSAGPRWSTRAAWIRPDEAVFSRLLPAWDYAELDRGALPARRPDGRHRPHPRRRARPPPTTWAPACTWTRPAAPGCRPSGCRRPGLGRRTGPSWPGTRCPR